MRAELKQIGYKPEAYDKDGGLKTPAYFTVTFNVDAAPEHILELRKLMGAGTPNFNVSFEAEQPTFETFNEQVKHPTLENIPNEPATN